jgi:hypothetical protein
MFREWTLTVVLDMIVHQDILSQRPASCQSFGINNSQIRPVRNGNIAFSVSHTNRDRAKRYIENQMEHHRTVSFQEELRNFFKRQGIEYDERYVWD